MELFGIGGWEFILVVVLALILFGPKDIQKAGKTIGSSLNKIIHSDTWQALTQTSKRLRSLPTELMREANLEEFQKSGPAKNGPGIPPGGAADPYQGWQTPTILPGPAPVARSEPEAEPTPTSDPSSGS